MKEFKVGDTVEGVINVSEHMRIGSIYEITKIHKCTHRDCQRRTGCPGTTELMILKGTIKELEYYGGPHSMCLAQDGELKVKHSNYVPMNSEPKDFNVREVI